jgi:predicted ArsR family transcriptional regulator
MNNPAPETLRVRILDALEAGPATIRELAERTGGTYNTVSVRCKQLTFGGLIHIADTRPSRGREQTGRPQHIYAMREAA